MKRTDLIRHILKNGCVFVREGSKHSVFINPKEKKISTIPRHKEIDNFLSRKICCDLGIRELNKK